MWKLGVDPKPKQVSRNCVKCTAASCCPADSECTAPGWPRIELAKYNMLKWGRREIIDPKRAGSITYDLASRERTVLEIPSNVSFRIESHTAGDTARKLRKFANVPASSSSLSTNGSSKGPWTGFDSPEDHSLRRTIRSPTSAHDERFLFADRPVERTSPWMSCPTSERMMSVMSGGIGSRYIVCACSSCS